MKIFIAGGTGFVGTSLTERLLQRGHDVTIISSSGKTRLPERSSLHCIQADTTKAGDWQNNLGDFDVIVNLAGRSIFHLWSDAYKDSIYSSRIETTRNIVAALPNGSDAVLLNASAAGYYGDQGDAELSEESSGGEDFLAKVCRDWEAEAFGARKKGARVAVMRFGVVLGAQGGAIATMKTPFFFGMGGPIGSGRQWFPWIHIQDLVEAIIFLIDGSGLQGPFNFAAPGCVRQKDFARTLGKTMKRPAFMPAPAWVMKTVLGEFGQSLLQGQRVVPKALRETGFLFSFPDLNGALKDILHG